MFGSNGSLPKPSRQRRKRSAIKQNAWKHFSRWIKKRDNWTCVTCGKCMMPGDPLCDAGHFISRSFLWTMFDERNVHCQCRTCNWEHERNPIPYYRYMEERYGVDVILELQSLAHQGGKMPESELLAIEQRYRQPHMKG